MLRRKPVSPSALSNLSMVRPRDGIATSCSSLVATRKSLVAAYNCSRRCGAQQGRCRIRKSTVQAQRGRGLTDR